MAHRDGIRHVDCRQNFGLTRHRIGWGRAVVEGQIHQSRGQIFHCLIAHVIGLCPDQPVKHILRQRLSGFGMGGIGAQDLGDGQPVFIKLAGQFHKIPRNRGARHGLIGHIRQDLMQRMAKFMKQCPRIVE